MSKPEMKPEENYAQDSFEAYGEYRYDYRSEGSSASAARPKRKRGINGFFRFLIFLCILTVAVVAVQETVFRLETVYVIGSDEKSPKSIVEASGLFQGRNMLSIEAEEVAANIEKDHSLIFKGLEKEYPGTIYLYIEERKIVASMQWLGLLYKLDAEGVVMEEKNASSPEAGMPVVTGMNANAVSVGQLISVRDPKQLDAYQTIMYEMTQQLCTDEFSEINLADPDNLYLVTAEGVTVRAGNAKNMQAKIGAVRTAMAYLRQLGKKGGILDVTKPEEAKYMPEDE